MIKPSKKLEVLNEKSLIYKHEVNNMCRFLCTPLDIVHNNYKNELKRIINRFSY